MNGSRQVNINRLIFVSVVKIIILNYISLYKYVTPMPTLNILECQPHSDFFLLEAAQSNTIPQVTCERVIYTLIIQTMQFGVNSSVTYPHSC